MTNISLERRRMRRGGILLLALPMLLTVFCVGHLWFYPPEWIKDLELRGPWDLGASLNIFFSRMDLNIVLAVPMLLGLWQILACPNIVSRITRWLGFIALGFLYLSTYLSFSAGLFPF